MNPETVEMNPGAGDQALEIDCNMYAQEYGPKIQTDYVYVKHEGATPAEQGTSAQIKQAPSSATAEGPSHGAVYIKRKVAP